jgi:hypothetical protein
VRTWYDEHGGGLLVEQPALCDTIILDFLTTWPVRTMAPIRRAQSG